MTLKKFVGGFVWIFKGIFSFLFKIWPLLAVVGAGILALMGLRAIKKAFFGIPEKPVNFVPIPNKPNNILIWTDQGVWEERALPEGVKFSQVVAAGYTSGGEVVVQIKHTPVDRKG